MSGSMSSVGLGEYFVSHDPMDVLIAFGLGSCLGIGMYDPVARVGGLIHVVLPEQKAGNDSNPAKFVDSGIPLLLKKLQAEGAVESRLVIKMAGGANMLVSPGLSGTFDIGTRNIQMAHQTLKNLHLKLHTEEVGGQVGRTVRLYVADGRMTVRMMGSQERDLGAVQK
ncbi:MAG: chemotaxis protein CheD [Leptolinea sp.]|nr:chemotaxis protein CheD [Leptolinea sp.]